MPAVLSPAGGSGDAGVSPSATRSTRRNRLGQNNNSLWVNSYVGDAFGSYQAPGTSLAHAIGSPGRYLSNPVPAPTVVGGTAACAALACLLVCGRAFVRQWVAAR